MPNGVFEQLIPSLKLDPYPAYLLLFISHKIIGLQLYEKGVSMKLETIAQSLRMSVPTVRKALAELESHALIRVERPKSGSGRGFPGTLRLYLTPPSFWPALCNDVS